MSTKNNLLLRILSGAALGAIAIWGVVWSNFVLNLILSVGGIIAGIEWTQIVRPHIDHKWDRDKHPMANEAGLIVLPVALFMLWVIGTRTHPADYISVLVLISGLLLFLLFARGMHITLRVLVGFPIIGATIISLLALHQGGNWHALIFLLTIVSATDIGAFAFGKAIGGKKLAPRISPNKTWAGSMGGLISASIVAAILSHWLGEVSTIHSAIVGVGISILAQAGDLLESALKRRFSVKDSGFLIPGHGGILDRIDGLLLAAPLFTLYRLWLGGLL